MPVEVEALAADYLQRQGEGWRRVIQTSTSRTALEKLVDSQKVDRLCELLLKEKAEAEKFGGSLPMTVVFVERKARADEIMTLLNAEGWRRRRFTEAGRSRSASSAGRLYHRKVRGSRRHRRRRARARRQGRAARRQPRLAPHVRGLRAPRGAHRSRRYDWASDVLPIATPSSSADRQGVAGARGG